MQTAAPAMTLTVYTDGVSSPAFARDIASRVPAAARAVMVVLDVPGVSSLTARLQRSPRGREVSLTFTGSPAVQGSVRDALVDGRLATLANGDVLSTDAARSFLFYPPGQAELFEVAGRSL